MAVIVTLSLVINLLAKIKEPNATDKFLMMMFISNN